jgi:hypothetical protein
MMTGTDKTRDVRFVKANFTIGQAMKGQSGRGSIAVLFL